LIHESVDLLARPLAGATLVVAVLVLLVTSSNVANLLLARGGARQAEFAVRYAMGASRWRLVREQIVESVALVVLSATAAVAIVRWALTEFTGSLPVRLGPSSGVELVFSGDNTIMLAAVVASSIALLVFGVAPALRLTRRDLHPPLNSHTIAHPILQWRSRRASLAAQVSVSVALVTVAVFTADQALRSVKRDTGIELGSFAAAAIDFRLVGYDEQRARDTLRRILNVVRRQSNAEAVALASGLPLGLSAPSLPVTAPGQELDLTTGRPRRARLLSVTPTLFEAIGVRVTRGRLLGSDDHATAERVAVVSEHVARQTYGTTDVVGRHIVLRPPPQNGIVKPSVTRTIVGVVKDTDVTLIGRRMEGIVYVPFEQHYEHTMAVVVRSARPETTAAMLPEMIRRADGVVAVIDAGTGLGLANSATVPLRISAGLTGVLGATALLVSMTGLYGVMSYLVSGRRREIAVRRAVGASSSAVMRLVVGDGLRPVLVGMTTGFILSGAIIYMAGRQLRAETRVDPFLASLVVLLFIGAAVIACLLPAQRAVRVEPSIVLKDQ
jgi:predicted permease